MAESDAKTELRKRAKALGWLSMPKAASPYDAKRGWPDEFFFRRGVTKAIEMKEPGEEPSKQQWRRINELRDHGIDAWWADNIPDALAILER